jgi:hypothetical protein
MTPMDWIALGIGASIMTVIVVFFWKLTNH